MKWKTKSGQEIETSDMNDGHLLNTIKFIRKYGKVLLLKEQLDFLKLPKPRGDGAQFAVEYEFNILLNTTTNEYCEKNIPIYNEMMEEQEKRGLNIDKDIQDVCQEVINEVEGCYYTR